MAKRKYTKKEMPVWVRLFYIIFGVVIASLLIIFSFRWEDLPFRIYGLGMDITPYALAPIIVIVGVLASTLTKSAMTGKYEVDS